MRARCGTKRVLTQLTLPLFANVERPASILGVRVVRERALGILLSFLRFL
jgi:hypothetical protein